MLTGSAQLSVAAYIRKSFLAAWIGNFTGALLVAVPAVYFYLKDDPAEALNAAEAGEGVNTSSHTASPDMREEPDRKLA
jgi:hypothetical protein